MIVIASKIRYNNGTGENRTLFFWRLHAHGTRKSEMVQQRKRVWFYHN